MALLAPGSLPWLVRHELRLAWRARRRKALTRWLGYLLATIYVLAGIAVAVALRDVPIHPDTSWYVGLLAVVATLASFMVAQSVLASQATLYETRDLDLLFTAPLPPRTTLLAKLLGIAATVTLTYFALLLPMAVPIALLGHPRLLGVVALLVGLGLGSASVGLAITLALARLSGPRAARTVGQIAAALLGGAVFLISQLNAHFDDGRRQSTYVRVYRWLRAHHLGSTGWSSWPGRAAFGEPLPVLAILGLGLAAFALVGAMLQRTFLTNYQSAGMRLARTRPSGRATRRHFRAGLFAAVFAKEWRLLVRDPALAFQVALRVVYSAPIVLIAFQHGHGPPVAPTIAFAAVLIGSQLAGSLAWLTVSAEDAPDLIAVSPVSKGEVDRAKLAAALAMAAPFAVLPAIAVAVETIAGALLTLVTSTLAATLTGWLEVKLGKPGQRAAFARRRQGSLAVGLLTLVIAFVFGGLAGVGVYLVS